MVFQRGVISVKIVEAHEARANILVLTIFVPDSAFVRAGAGVCGACPTKPHGGSHHAGDHGCPLGDGHAVLLLFHPQGKIVYNIIISYWTLIFYYVILW